MRLKEWEACNSKALECSSHKWEVEAGANSLLWEEVDGDSSRLWEVEDGDNSHQWEVEDGDNSHQWEEEVMVKITDGDDLIDHIDIALRTLFNLSHLSLQIIP